jgi:hypothetical protein
MRHALALLFLVLVAQVVFAQKAEQPRVKELAYFVEPQRGNDTSDGDEQRPWKTIRHALTRLKAGDTLYLRAGTYYENVAVRLVGRPDAPITIRSFPGEEAIIDGGIREFFEKPAAAWQPYEKAGEGEYRSAQRYPNLRHVLGLFADTPHSMIGLQSYYHAIDLRAGNERWGAGPGEAGKVADFLPVYCGPGLWYDQASGYIHVRLAHTRIPAIINYRGETDPRKLPLVIAPFRSVPLHVDGARHVRFADLAIRGGGYDTVVLDQARDIEFDNVTVFCGTFGLRATGTQRLKFHRSALRGSIAPWSFRTEAGLQSYPWRPQRDITRLNTHALLVAECGREFSVYAYPLNDDWEIAHSHFSGASDGLYLGGINLRFHHNRVENMHDDGIYLSPMYPRHFYLRGGARAELFQNYFSRCLTALAFGGTEDTKDTVYIYRNVFDLRAPVQAGRPTTADLKPHLSGGKVMGDHGSPPWPSMMIYHNTFLQSAPARDATMGTLGAGHSERPRRAFNNIFLHLAGIPPQGAADAERNVHADGNLFWQPGLEAKRAALFFAAYRASPAFANSKRVYAAGFDANSLVADPRFVKGDADSAEPNDYRLQAGSPAIDAGVAIAPDWPDPLREFDKGKPDIGALPLGVERFLPGRPTTP